MALGIESGGKGTCSDEKNQRKNFSCQCPFKETGLLIELGDGHGKCSAAAGGLFRHPNSPTVCY